MAMTTYYRRVRQVGFVRKGVHLPICPPASSGTLSLVMACSVALGKAELMPGSKNIVPEAEVIN
jgi:hypothetical protein